MSNISSISSLSSSSNNPRPSDAWRDGSWDAGRPKAGEKRPREAVGQAGRSEDDSPEELDDVQFEKVEQRKDPIANATIDDVEFTVEFVNPHKRINKTKPRNEKDYTRLVAIGSHSAKGLLLDDLKRFATRIGITGSRAWGKQKVCEAIVDYKIDPAASLKKQAKKKKAVVVNRKRFINVLFDEVFLPKLSTRGQSLNKDQLTDGIKTDELLFRDFVVLYNNKHDFNEDEHPELGVKGDPSDFTPITWEVARKTFRDLMKDYEGCVANWKRSGNHGAFGDNQKKPFSDFQKNRGDMLYLHEFAHQFPDALQHVITQLNEDAFHESISDDEVGTAVGSELAKLATNKKKKKQTPRKSSPGDNIAAAILALWTGAKARNKVQKYSIVVESERNTGRVLREHKNDWKRVVADASKEKNKSQSFIKDEYKKFKQEKENPPKRSAVEERLASLSDSDDDTGIPGNRENLLSQQSDSLNSVFEELYEIDVEIQKAKRRLAYLETEANNLEINGENNKENETVNGED